MKFSRIILFLLTYLFISIFQKMYFIWIYNNVQTRYFKCDFLKTFMVFDKSLLLIFDQFCILTATHHQVSTLMQIAMQVHFWTILLFCGLVKNKVSWKNLLILDKFSLVTFWVISQTGFWKTHPGHLQIMDELSRNCSS